MKNHSFFNNTSTAVAQKRYSSTADVISGQNNLSSAAEISRQMEEEDESAVAHLASSGSGALNRQASRSTEDMFTPVIKKHSKWKNKKIGITSKDDSGHTYSTSSSSASSTASFMAVANASSHSSSILSAKPK